VSNDRHLIFLLHGLIRAHLLARPVDEAYLAICKSVYPGAVFGNFSSLMRSRDHRYLNDICDYIYELDRNESSYASCYSASIAVQLVAITCGIDSEIAIGVKKQDKKIIGHAWVETRGFQPKKIITPGRTCIDGFKIVKHLHPETSIQAWMEKKRAALDLVVES
jgi:hypothetical protein